MEIDYSSYGEEKIWAYDSKTKKVTLETNVNNYYAYFPILVSSKEKYLISIY